MTWRDLITIDVEHMHGTACMKGTPFTVCWTAMRILSRRVLTMLALMYSSGFISYQNTLSDPQHIAETTWNQNSIGERQPGSERIALHSSLDTGDFYESVDLAHYWLAHEAGHVYGETHPEIAGANTATGLACY